MWTIDGLCLTLVSDTQVTLNEEIDPNLLIKRLKQEIKVMKVDALTRENCLLEFINETGHLEGCNALVSRPTCLDGT